MSQPSDEREPRPSKREPKVNYVQQLPGGVCFAHGPYTATIGCPQWPKCITDPQKEEYKRMVFEHINPTQPTPPVPSASPAGQGELASEIEKILFRRCIEHRLEGYTLETSHQIAAMVAARSAPSPAPRWKQLERLVREAYSAFCDMGIPPDGSKDTRWMLEAQIMLQGGELPRNGMTVGELRNLLAATVPAAPVSAGPERDPNRCAICGWPLAESWDKGCVRGNCSLRPFPETFYDPERAERERIGRAASQEGK